ncbi:hypothetical protein [Clostridium sp. ZBS3]|uniref:hypothetical protein n=1 Tax=Clostridium sp. ZBS3 TaxID=2949975 RepID=UPI0013F0D5B7|nr:hypothetical protein [Clostridium sp. ZBS3]NFH89855.1 hypothetical protein [Clostridium botulinum]NFI19546.1 hypothetical protein [Clostridium botulinum]NFI51611.1 hypothetical protein [Clostridium botulinum]NFN50826.1 hypothetical protein [Clostridium botulinum]NFO28629.1 hypothetical protein [Clostridium botulinum]
MKYGTLKKSKLHLVAMTTKNISQNKNVDNSLDLSEVLTKLWNCISNLFNNNSESIYDSNNSYNHNNKYTVEDPTEITLISSRRTFY